MGKDLFEGSSCSEEDEGASDIKINEEFARRFEHNKRREDLQRYEELKKRGAIEDSGSSSSEESEEEWDEDLVGSNKNELQFYDALVKVKKQDPVLNEKETKLFDSDHGELNDEVSGENVKEEKTKKKPMYLKDVVAKHLLEGGPEFEENTEGLTVKSYKEEQEEIRQAFLREAGAALNNEGDDDDEEFLVEKKSNADGGGFGADEGDLEIQRRLDEYFGEDGNLSENEMFLKSFFKNKLWVGEEKGMKPLADEHTVDFSEDENELERQDQYESEYNFRHEEGAGDRVLGYSRFVEGSVRKTSNTRKEQRKMKSERMKKAEFERQEELKHLKNVKRKEIMEKVEKIKKVAGITEGVACAFDGDELEEEFDPEKYDRVMKKTFNEEYYDAEDIDPGFGSSDDEYDLGKPDFEKEDNILELPKNWDVIPSGKGFRDVRKRMLENDEVSDADFSNELSEEEGRAEGGKRKRKRKMSLREKVALDKALEEYYKLDYEDVIGDLKTRFKYTPVPPNKYGLSTEEILMTDEKELNQYVSLKKIAPFREKEWKVSKHKRYQEKKLLCIDGKKKVEAKNDKKHHKSKPIGQVASSAPYSLVNGRTPLQESIGQGADISRKSRRKKHLAEYKLSNSRLMAYGKIHPKRKKQRT